MNSHEKDRLARTASEESASNIERKEKSSKEGRPTSCPEKSSKESKTAERDQNTTSDAAAYVASIEAQLHELKSQYVRALADLENTRRRAQKEKEETVKFGTAGLAKDVLLFMDNLERALGNLPQAELTPEMTQFIDGVNMIYRDANSMLERHGVFKIESKGKVFDPEFHQAVSDVAVDGVPSGTVVETLQAGYTINGRLLRAALVSVAK
ncbi:MAG: nucleotide exchange factor GrpE [Holosporales bacterium]|jgi:molecular chaperone GrpE|nr:nucleotide exchange factor GrpE [Holosporales bacterium]